MPRPGKIGAVHPVMPGDRPAAPSTLTPAMREEWETIVAAMPATWFKPEMLALLEQHVRTIVYLHEVTAELDQLSLDDARFSKLYGKYTRLVAILASYAQKLRLTAQAQRRPTYNDVGPGTTDKPWSN